MKRNTAQIEHDIYELESKIEQTSADSSGSIEDETRIDRMKHQLSELDRKRTQELAMLYRQASPLQEKDRDTPER